MTRKRCRTPSARRLRTRSIASANRLSRRPWDDPLAQWQPPTRDCRSCTTFRCYCLARSEVSRFRQARHAIHSTRGDHEAGDEHPSGLVVWQCESCAIRLASEHRRGKGATPTQEPSGQLPAGVHYVLLNHEAARDVQFLAARRSTRLYSLFPGYDVLGTETIVSGTARAIWTMARVPKVLRPRALFMQGGVDATKARLHRLLWLFRPYREFSAGSPEAHERSARCPGGHSTTRGTSAVRRGAARRARPNRLPGLPE
jgi:hypothetical protein